MPKEQVHELFREGWIRVQGRGNRGSLLDFRQGQRAIVLTPRNGLFLTRSRAVQTSADAEIAAHPLSEANALLSSIADDMSGGRHSATSCEQRTYRQVVHADSGRIVRIFYVVLVGKLAVMR